jgi:RHS repeat-associated protein
VGNVTALASSAGVLQAGYRYDPYGALLAHNGTQALNNTLRHAGKPWVAFNNSPTAGLAYFGYRFYSPQLQRWINRDPIHERGGINLYGYVGNEPMGWMDPDGASPAPLVARAGYIVGALIGDYLYDKYVDPHLDEFFEKHLDPEVAENARRLKDILDAARTIKNPLKAGKKLCALARNAKRNAKNTFPKNPDDLLPDMPRTPKGHIEPNPHTRIRPEKHPLKPGETYAPRHHGQHYHVETRVNPSKSWNNPNNVTKIKPPGYVPGEGTGFLPGEKFP